MTYALLLCLLSLEPLGAHSRPQWIKVFDSDNSPLLDYNSIKQDGVVRTVNVTYYDEEERTMEVLTVHINCKTWQHSLTVWDPIRGPFTGAWRL